MAAALLRIQANYLLERYHKLQFFGKVRSLLFRLAKLKTSLVGLVVIDLILHCVWSVVCYYLKDSVHVDYSCLDNCCLACTDRAGSV